MSSIDFFLCDKFLIQLKGLRSHIQPKSKSNKNIFFLSFICSFSYVGVFFLFALYTSICIYLPAVSVEWKKEEIQNIFFSVVVSLFALQYDDEYAYTTPNKQSRQCFFIIVESCALLSVIL